MKLLKFDTIHPTGYLFKKQKNNTDEINQLCRDDYLKWLISLRSNYSDFYTYNLNNLGWESEEFITNDPLFIEKTAHFLYGKRLALMKTKERMRRRRLSIDYMALKEKVIVDYVNHYNPDVIFVREHSTLQSNFWSKFKNEMLIVGRLAAPMPQNWNPQDFDLLITSLYPFKDFFEACGTPSYIIGNGFDDRILNEIGDSENEFDVTFIGGLGSAIFEQRTALMEYVSKNTDFKWWGYGINDINEGSPLQKTWQGITSGLEMFQIYKKSKIVLNDYLRRFKDAKGLTNNQRMFEVMGVGAFLLMRDAPSLKEEFPDDIFVTFTDEKDCLEKINYYLQNEDERNEIAKAGQEYVLKNFSYKKLMAEVDNIIKDAYFNKFHTRI